MNVRVRIAPSPTGYFHIGTARTALFNWLYARKNNGSFLLRIEDTDKERSNSEYTFDIFEGLKWLGLNWDEDPVIQSNRTEEHREAINKLLSEGLAYRCYTTEKELQLLRENQIKQGKPPRYDNRHRDLSKEQEENFIQEGRNSVIRFRVDDQTSVIWNDMIRGRMEWNSKDLGGDFVISRRAEANQIGDPLYNLVVVVDDAAMRITHIIRGEDHIANTAKQILLYQALSLKPPIFAHTPLILNTEGKKLSKRDGVTSIIDFKEMGYTAKSMTNYMTLLGWSPPEEMGEIFTLEESSSVFDFDRVNKAGAKFDWEKLKWLNSQEIHSWTPSKLLDYLIPLWQKEGWEIPSKDWGLKLAELIGPSLTILNDGLEQARFFFNEPSLKDDGIEQLKIEGAKRCLSSILQCLEDNPWDGNDISVAKLIISNSSKSLGLKKGLIMKSLRSALMGTTKGPDLLTSWSLLAMVGKDLNRIKNMSRYEC